MTEKQLATGNLSRALDHLRKADMLHGYCESKLNEAVQHAIEAGRELIAAKSMAPHGSWEELCGKYFHGSLRTAQGYMRLCNDLEAIPKAQRAALLLTESTLEGAAKAARAANPKKTRRDSDSAPGDGPSQPLVASPLSLKTAGSESKLQRAGFSGGHRDSLQAESDGGYCVCPTCGGSGRVQL